MLIEQGMIFALGFLVALLLVLFFLPAFWNRAIRLSIRKIGERLPLSMAEVAAERDGLRAESAITQLRLEQARDRALAERDTERGNVGRLATKLAEHDIELDVLRLDATTRDRSLIETRQALLAAEAELGAMHKDHYDAGAQLERAVRDADAQHVEQQRLRDLADQRRITITGLETRLEDMQSRIDDLEGSLRDADRLRGSQSTLAAAGGSNEDRAHIAELDGRMRRLEGEKRALEQDLAAARSAGAAERPANDGAAADADEIAVLRKSISDVAAEVVRLGGLRETATPILSGSQPDAAQDAANVLQIRRIAGRDGPAKGPPSDPLQQGHGKSVGAT